MYDEVARLPQVQRSARITAYQIYGLDADGRIDQFFGAQAVTTEPSGNFIVGNPKLLSGRLPRPDAANEVLINRFLAQRHALRPGSQITMRLFRGRLPDNPALADVGASTPVTFTVVGVGVFTNDVVPTNLLFLISFRDGAEHKEGIAATDQALERTCRGVCLIERSQAPGEVVAYERVRLTPVALAGVLAALPWPLWPRAW